METRCSSPEYSGHKQRTCGRCVAELRVNSHRAGCVQTKHSHARCSITSSTAAQLQQNTYRIVPPYAHTTKPCTAPARPAQRPGRHHLSPTNTQTQTALQESQSPLRKKPLRSPDQAIYDRRPFPSASRLLIAIDATYIQITRKKKKTQTDSSSQEMQHKHTRTKHAHTLVSSATLQSTIGKCTKSVSSGAQMAGTDPGSCLLSSLSFPSSCSTSWK